MNARAEDRRLRREADKIGGGIVIAWLSPGMVTHAFTESLMAEAMWDANHDQRWVGRFGGYISMQTSPRIVRARTDVVQSFLTNPEFRYASWLVTIDSDMSWERGAVLSMIKRAEEADIAVVAGLCYAGRSHDQAYPTVYTVQDTTEEGFPVVQREDLVDIWPQILEKRPLMKVDATGAACMAIRRDVLLHMYDRFADDGKNPYPFYAEMIGPNGAEVGEDITFCLRARQLGYEVAIDTEAEFGHHKLMALDSVSYAATKGLASPS